MSWRAFFSGNVGNWTKQALASLGMGVVTFTAFNTAKSAVDSAVQSGLGSIPGEVYQIIALAGFIDAVGIWLGAIAAAVTFAAVGRISMLQG